MSEVSPERLRVLFVCSRNQWRSPTAESVFSRHPAIDARSAGTSKQARQRVNEKSLAWAEVVLVMEQKHKQRIQGSFDRLVKHLPIVVLDIPDDYQRMDPELVDLLKRGVPAVLAPWLGTDDPDEPHTTDR